MDKGLTRGGYEYSDLDTSPQQPARNLQTNIIDIIFNSFDLITFNPPTNAMLKIQKFSHKNILVTFKGKWKEAFERVSECWQVKSHPLSTDNGNHSAVQR